MATLVSIQVGQPARYGREGAADPHDQPWTTAFYKSPVAGPVRATATQLAGDGQADLANHGGVNKAVLAYSADHYPFWQQELARTDLPYGGFGENLTIAGLTEADVCIGDRWELGEAVLEVSQPRQPCWKLARRWRMKDLAARVVANGRSGWYFRVLQEGWIAPGQPIVLVSRPHADWPVTRVQQVFYRERQSAALHAELAQVPALAASWRAELLARAARG